MHLTKGYSMGYHVQGEKVKGDEKEFGLIKLADETVAREFDEAVDSVKPGDAIHVGVVIPKDFPGRDGDVFSPEAREEFIKAFNGKTTTYRNRMVFVTVKDGEKLGVEKVPDSLHVDNNSNNITLQNSTTLSVSGFSLNWTPPKHLIAFFAPGGKFIGGLRSEDFQIEYAKGFGPNDATKVFWESMQDCIRTALRIPEVKVLQDENERLKKALYDKDMADIRSSQLCRNEQCHGQMVRQTAELGEAHVKVRELEAKVKELEAQLVKGQGSTL